MSNYYISPHVHACRTEQHIVLLDLRCDKYLAIDSQTSMNLQGVVEEWPKDPAFCARESTAEAANEGLLSEMIARGLLTTSRVIRDAPPISALVRPTASLFAAYEDATPAITVASASRFMFSTLATTISFRAHTLYSNVCAVRARKRSRASRGRVLPLSLLRELVSTFDRLRPIAFTALDQCLFDSLALVNFLAVYDVYPDWIVGVKGNPFGAHSWVQYEDTVLNDLHDNVGQFTPILAV